MLSPLRTSWERLQFIRNDERVSKQPVELSVLRLSMANGKAIVISRKEIRAGLQNQKFSRYSALHIGLQILAAIQQLHAVGYIHRDIKPANFCLSLQDAHQLVMVDFGMCRKYLDPSSKLIRHPRWFVRGFKGTVRYAALSVHLGRESCRKDDLESAFYLLVELLVGTLPWMTMEDIVHVEHAKQISRTTNRHEFLSGCPKQLVHILIYIDDLKYYDAPDYALIRGLLMEALKKCPENWEFEWEKDERSKTKSNFFIN
uniref:non-specific serine/threonine protein kinase n=1 Tax=Caenorhabditis japonica TaxID=281687 RepID=A0A8R1DUY5_CAEJA